MAAAGKVDVAQHVDLLIGVVPVINLEWIQKPHRDKATQGYSTETILGRMLDYVNDICPQCCTTRSCRAPTPSSAPVARWISIFTPMIWRLIERRKQALEH